MEKAEEGAGTFPLIPSDPAYEFLSYFECCSSLGIRPSVKKFLRYQELWKSHIQEHSS
jgi:hypothetical protein